MRKAHYSFLILLAVFFITSSTITPHESKRLFEKVVFVELNSHDDSVLFTPLSKAWGEFWQISSDVDINGTELMNYDKYTFSFKDRKDNLWTILHPMIINGTVQSYFPYDPESFGLGHSDDGELRYPVADENETFLSSKAVRENLCNLLGQFGPASDVPLVDEWGDPIIVDLEDGTQSFKYPSPDFYWFKDKNITKYKLRISVLLNKKGKEKKRVIKSICPIVEQMSETGKTHTRELIWLDFEELKPFLKSAYYVDSDWKPQSYLNYFLQKVKNAQLRDVTGLNSN